MTTDTGTDDPAAAQTDTGGRRHRLAYSQDRSKTRCGAGGGGAHRSAADHLMARP
jgi:hypothetical protein